MEHQIKIHIRDKENNEKDIYAKQGSLLFDVLIQNGISFKGNCGKKRACNACMVYFEEEQEWKKSCSYVLQEDISIMVSGLLEEKNMVLLAGAEKSGKETSRKKEIVRTEKTNIGFKEAILKKASEKVTEKENMVPNREDVVIEDKKNVIRDTFYGMAIDLGTTTIAFLLFDLESMETIDQFGMMNPQRIHGADVASRITYGSEPAKVKELKLLFEDAFNKALLHFKQHLGEDGRKLKRIGISGNTVMMHILQEIPLTSLGSFPFTTGNVEEVNIVGREFFLNEELKKRFSETKILLSPCSSAYIGGDVLVGAISEEFDLADEISLFLDLGTNGEMLLGKKGKFYSASTAAGPAFEGSFRTQHIHGTRLIDFLVMARRQKWLDEYGKICDRFFEKGIPFGAGTYLTQDVIRSIQLAKSAIYAGIMLLCKSYGITPSEISKVYIAGGFGFYLNVSSAIFIKMFPPELDKKITVVGNSSLSGMKLYMTGEFKERMKTFREGITNIELANMEEFQECYIGYLNL
ncbi:MAG: DUF4445 domain-containing protein [Lachnospiraceae bacterium]|nr:DUF4445 domain-containing protein [Lachnospiraceae bacterium]